MREFVYPARLTPDNKDCGFIVTFRDIPEAITQGETVDDCLEEAAGALQVAVEGRILGNLEIPPASKPRAGECAVPVPIQTALKAALFLEMQQAGIIRVELACRLSIDEKEVRRMLDPYHPTKADLLDAYPQLTKEDIHAAMFYAADTLAHEETVLLDKQA